MTPMMSAIFLLGGVDVAHRGDRRAHHRAALLRLLARGHRELVGLAGVVGGLLDGRGHLFHRRGGLLEARGLLLGALREIGIAAEISSAPPCTSLAATLMRLTTTIMFSTSALMPADRCSNAPCLPSMVMRAVRSPAWLFSTVALTSATITAMASSKSFTPWHTAAISPVLPSTGMRRVRSPLLAARMAACISCTDTSSWRAICTCCETSVAYSTMRYGLPLASRIGL